MLLREQVWHEDKLSFTTRVWLHHDRRQVVQDVRDQLWTEILLFVLGQETRVNRAGLLAGRGFRQFNIRYLWEWQCNEANFVWDSLFVLIDLILVQSEPFIVDLSQRLLATCDQHVLFWHNEPE